MSESNQPKRPTNVPKEAKWHETWQDWILCSKGEENKQATFQWWDAEGKVYGEFEGYKKGNTYIFNGYSEAFYKNGEPQLSEVYEHGIVKKEDFFYMCTDSSLDMKNFSSLGMDVWYFKHFYENGINVCRKYYTKDNKEVDYLGNSLPLRPKNVHKYARYVAEEEYWFYGATTKRNDEIIRLGTWQWWTKRGRIKGFRSACLARAAPCMVLMGLPVR